MHDRQPFHPDGECWRVQIKRRDDQVVIFDIQYMGPNRRLYGLFWPNDYYPEENWRAAEVGLDLELPLKY